MARRAAIKVTSVAKLFSTYITAEDHAEIIARGSTSCPSSAPLSKNCAFLVRGYVAVGTAMPVARRSFPRPEYHRASHSAVTSSRTQRGYTAVVHTKLNKSSEPQAATYKPSLVLPVTKMRVSCRLLTQCGMA